MHARTLFSPLTVLIFVLLTFAITQNASAATYVVNTSEDNENADGSLSLREAIKLARYGSTRGDGAYGPLGRCITNAEKAQVQGMCYTPFSVREGDGCWNTVPCDGDIPGTLTDENRKLFTSDNIIFDKSVGTIFLKSELPTLGLNDNIDGLKSDGTKVIIDGSGAGSDAHGLLLFVRHDISYCDFGYADLRTSNRVLNLVITNFASHGIEGAAVQNSVFQGLEITKNGGNGIYLHATSCFQIVASHSNLIGGPGAAERNFISGNRVHGILLEADPNADNPAEHNNRIQNNFIGAVNSKSSDFGLIADGNRFSGIEFQNVRGSTIGGDDPSLGNLIVANGGNGILLASGNSTGNVVRNNIIGVGVDRKTPLGNMLSGVSITDGANDNLIGDPAGTVRLPANIIAFNKVDGVFVFASQGNRIQGNAIFSNERLGINLSGGFENQQVSANDAGDVDEGSNTLQNAPELRSAEARSTLTVTGVLKSSPNDKFIIELFGNEKCDESGFGEGQRRFKRDSVLTQSDGGATFSFTLGSPLADFAFVTATATNEATRNTSEFSNCVAIKRTGTGVGKRPTFEIPRTNFALASNGGIATASSEFGPGFPASASINGNRRGLGYLNGVGAWASVNNDNIATSPEWLQIEFAGRRMIDELDIFTLQDNYDEPIEPTLQTEFTKWGIVNFYFEYWTGTAWARIPIYTESGRVINNRRVWRSFTFPRITTQKIRVMVTKTAAPADFPIKNVARVVEFEAWGTSLQLNLVP